jgi:energy-coupling factor transporter ATP-binding protein EcfA2
MISLQVPANPPIHPAFDFEIGRINVFLGSNGMGKTQLLRRLQQEVSQQPHKLQQHGLSHALMVDGNRVLSPFNGQSSQNRVNVANAEMQAEQGLLNSEQSDPGTLNLYSELMLEALCKDHSRAVREHSDTCLSIQGASPPAAIPSRRQSKLDIFNDLFHYVFPDITLTFDPENVRVQCTKGGQPYTPASFSTGERQIFLLLGKFIATKTPALFLIDEATRNLNASLAEKFWSRMEQYRSESIFIYAEHHAPFALREGVDKVFLVQRSQISIVADTIEFARLPYEERREYLGAIPAIVAHKRVLATEGDSDGLDELFYSYILKDPKLHVEPLGDCCRVLNAVKAIGPWNVIAPDVKVKGLVDCDYLPMDQLEHFRQSGVFVLPYHEVESILCHPEVILSVCEKMLPEGFRPDQNKILDRFVAVAKKERFDIVFKRLTELLRRKINVSGFQNDTVQNISEDAVAIAIAQNNIAQLKEYIGELDVALLLQNELQRLDTAITSRNVDELLLLVPGKRLLQATRSFYGEKMKENESVVDLIKFHFPEANIPVFNRLRQGILELFTDVNNQT